MEASFLAVEVKKPCGYCGVDKELDGGVVTHSDKIICTDCAIFHNFCEICGSTTKENQTNAPVDPSVKEMYILDDQQHFDEWCVK